MTLQTVELIEIRRREQKRMADRYEICVFAFGECDDAKDFDIFYRFCDKKGRNCVLFKDYNEVIYPGQ